MEENNKDMTVKGAVEKVIEVLGRLDVPMAKIDTLGLPIANCIAILQGCIDAWNRENDMTNEAKETEA